jgi:hypothetical protein
MEISMADFDTKPLIEAFRRAMDEKEKSYSLGPYGKVTAVEIPPTKYDFSYLTDEQVIGYVKGTKV